jgi:hypothetical protein
MKIDTAAIVTKGACFVIIGGMTPLASGLSQWIEGGTIPKLNWIVIIAGCFVGAATQMLAFLSQSFGDYKAQVRADAGQPPTPLMVGKTPIAEGQEVGKLQP